MMSKRLLFSLGIIAVAHILQGCASSGYTITKPVASEMSYEGSAAPVSSDVTIRDARGPEPEYFSFGVLPAELRIDDVAFDPIDFLRTHVDQELRARGLDSGVTDNGELAVDVKTLQMRNHRTNGWTPFITLTMLSADVATSNGPERVGIFIMRGKVPVWSFSEVVEPIFSQPMDLLVKELVAKLNRIGFGQSLPDETVQGLIDGIQNAEADQSTFLEVYQLGFSNNPSAIPALAELTSHSEQYVRLAAVSSLGTMKAEEHIDLLKSIQEDPKSWPDRAMALKALGDIGTSESLDYLKNVQSALRSDKGKESQWNVEIIDLYLRD